MDKSLCIAHILFPICKFQKLLVFPCFLLCKFLLWITVRWGAGIFFSFLSSLKIDIHICWSVYTINFCITLFVTTIVMYGGQQTQNWIYGIKSKNRSNNEHRVEVTTFSDCKTASILLLDKNIRNELFYVEDSTSLSQPKFLNELNIALWTLSDIVVIKYIYKCWKFVCFHKGYAVEKHYHGHLLWQTIFFFQVIFNQTICNLHIVYKSEVRQKFFKKKETSPQKQSRIYAGHCLSGCWIFEALWDQRFLKTLHSLQAGNNTCLPAMCMPVRKY